MIRPLILDPMPEEPLVSVLIASYNYAGYIGEAIESVLAQTYTRFELVVCDDGSTDSSWDVITRFAKEWNQIKPIRTQNRGQAAAFNQAYARATGDIICFLDADDRYLPGRLDRVVSTFRASPECGLVIHPASRITESGIKRGVLPLFARMPSGWCAPAMLSRSGILPNLPAGCVCCLRRAVAGRVFPLPVLAITRNFGDTFIIRLAPLVTSIASVPEPLYEYRQHGRNNGNVQAITPAHIDRELEVYSQVWKIQREFIAGTEPGLETTLASLEKNQHVLTMKYLRARLNRDHREAERLRKCLKPREWIEEPLLRRYFWRAAPFMPDYVFETAARLMLSQSRIKQLLAPLARVLTRRPFEYA